MKSITLLVTLICLGLSSLIAQTPQIEWGPEFKQDPNVLSIMAGMTSEGFYTFNILSTQTTTGKVVQKYVKLQAFSNDMLQTNEGQIKLKYKGENRSFERFLLLNNQLFMFTSYQEKKARRQVLLVETIDLNTLSSQGEPTEITSMTLPEKKSLGAFQISISKDSSKVLVYANNPGLERQKEKYSFFVFDDKMQKLWTLEEKLPYEDNRFRIYNLKVSNEGNVIISAVRAEIQSKNRFKETLSLKEIHLYLYLQNGTERQQYVLEVNDHQIATIAVELSPKGELICGGFYQKQGQRGLEGTFLLRYDTQTQDLVAESYHPFEKEILTKMIGEEAVDQMRSPTSYLHGNMILKQDGGIVLVTESYYIESRLTSTNEGHVFKDYYHYENVLVANLASDGEVNWYKLLEKKQVTQNVRMYSSYKMLVMPDRLYFIYNDSKRNYQGDQDTTYNFSLGRDAMVSLVTLNLDGSIEKEGIIDSKEEGVLFIPALSLHYKKNEMLLRAKKRRKSRYARVIF